MMRRVPSVFIALASVLCTAIPAVAQAPPPPPKDLTVAISAGFALTSGNTDTSTVNFGYDIKYDPHATNPAAKNALKSDALFLRSSNDDVLNTNRLSINGRDEYALSDRAFVYGQLQYLHDQFKQIDYLISPTGGLGYKVVTTPSTALAVDVGIGGVWEKNPGFDVNSSGALTFGDKFSHKISSNSLFTQSFSALYKTTDFGDSLYVTGAGVAASVSTRIQLKFDVLDTYKRKPPVAGVQKNDVAVVIAFVYKT